MWLLHSITLLLLQLALQLVLLLLWRLLLSLVVLSVVLPPGLWNWPGTQLSTWGARLHTRNHKRDIPLDNVTENPLEMSSKHPLDTLFETYCRRAEPQVRFKKMAEVSVMIHIYIITDTSSATNDDSNLVVLTLLMIRIMLMLLIQTVVIFATHQYYHCHH